MKLDIVKLGLVAGAIGLFYWMFKDSKEAEEVTPAATPPAAKPTPTPLKGLGGHRKSKKSKKKK